MTFFSFMLLFSALTALLLRVDDVLSSLGRAVGAASSAFVFLVADSSLLVSLAPRLPIASRLLLSLLERDCNCLIKACVAAEDCFDHWVRRAR